MSKICDTCIKEDVCKFREEFIDTVNKIGKIQEETNLVQTDISCKKYNKKYNAGYNRKSNFRKDSSLDFGNDVPVKMG